MHRSRLRNGRFKGDHSKSLSTTKYATREREQRRALMVKAALTNCLFLWRSAGEFQLSLYEVVVTRSNVSRTRYEWA